MPAPVVYDGVDSASGGGSLFSGVKFWVGARVPQRSRWVEAIKQNQGEVVPLEKMADMLIADPALPKHVPDRWESYSWKFIEDAVNSGEIPDKEPYLITRRGSSASFSKQSRSVAASSGSGVHTRATRTPYTAEDDRVLTEWCRQHLDQAKANDIYKELELKNNRHTWQSWRDRWVKRLCHLPGNDEPLPPSPTDVGEESSEDKAPSGAQSPGPPRAPPRNESTAEEDDAPDGVQSPEPPRARNRFTAEEDKRLLKCVNDARRQGLAIGGKLLYEEFAAKNPTHPAQAWRSRFTRVLALREENEMSEVEEGAGPSSPGAVSSRTRRQKTNSHEPNQRRRVVRDDEVKLEDVDDDNAFVADAAPADDLARSHSPAEADNPAPEGYEKYLEIDAPTDPELQGLWLDSSVRKALVGLARLFPIAKGFLMRDLLRQEFEEANRGSEADEDDDDQAKNSPPAQDELDNELQKTEFYRSLREYGIACPERRIHFAPRIDGRDVDLWDLYRLVNRQQPGDVEAACEKADWVKVAVSLGFDDTEESSVPDEVFRCFDANLFDFVLEQQFIADGGLEDSGDADGDEEMVDADGRVPDEKAEADVVAAPEGEERSDDDEIPDLEQISSLIYPNRNDEQPPADPAPKPANNLKRRFDESDNGRDAAPPSSMGPPSSKRVKLGPEVEIPATPQAPSRFTRPSSGKVPRSALANASRAVEPETQEWYCDPMATQEFIYGGGGDDGEPVAEEEASQPDISPSQQLRSEFADDDPTPRRRFFSSLDDDAPPTQQASNEISVAGDGVQEEEVEDEQQHHGLLSEKARGKLPEERAVSPPPPRRRGRQGPGRPPPPSSRRSQQLPLLETDEPTTAARETVRRTLPLSFGNRPGFPAPNSAQPRNPPSNTAKAASLFPAAQRAPASSTLAPPPSAQPPRSTRASRQSLTATTPFSVAETPTPRRPTVDPSPLSSSRQHRPLQGSTPRTPNTAMGSAGGPTEDDILASAMAIAKGKRAPPRSASKASAAAFNANRSPELGSSSSAAARRILQPRPVVSATTRPVSKPPARTSSSSNRPSAAPPSTTAKPVVPSSSSTAVVPGSRIMNQSPRRNIDAPANTTVPTPQAVEAQIEHWESLGYPRAFMSKLLPAASFDNALVNKVLDEERRRLETGGGSGGSGSGKGGGGGGYRVPSDKEGVWTESDDEDLRVVVSFDAKRRRGAGDLSSSGGRTDGGSAEEEARKKRIEKDVQARRRRLLTKHKNTGVWGRETFLKMRRDMAAAAAGGGVA